MVSRRHGIIVPLPLPKRCYRPYVVGGAIGGMIGFLAATFLYTGLAAVRDEKQAVTDSRVLVKTSSRVASSLASSPRQHPGQAAPENTASGNSRPALLLIKRDYETTMANLVQRLVAIQESNNKIGPYLKNPPDALQDAARAAHKQALDALEKDLAACVGLRLEWRVRIADVLYDQNSTSAVLCAVEIDSWRSGGKTVVDLGIQHVVSGSRLSVANRLKIGEHIPRGLSAQLARGRYLTVRGTLARAAIKFDSLRGAGHIMLVMTNVKALV